MMNLVKANEPWLDVVPDDWKRSRIKNVSLLSPGYSDHPPRNGELCAVVPMEKVSDNGRVDTSDQISFEDIQSGLSLFEKGDVLFAKITPCMENGKGAFVESLSTQYAFGSTEFHVLRPSHAVDGKFLYFYTFNSIFRAYAAENMSGAAGQKRVSSRFIKDTRLFLPPLTEQRRIAAYLDKTCAAIDAAIEKKQKQLETLDALRKSIIHNAVTRGLDDSVELKDSGIEFFGLSPQNWRRTKLRYEVSIRNGDFVSDKLDDEGEYPVVGGNGLMGKTATYNVNGDVVVIGRVGAYCGIAHYIPEKAWISDNALIVESACNKRFLTHLFNALDFNTEANRTAQPVITGTKIKNTYVMLSPIQEQGDISNYIDSKNAEITALQRNLNNQVATLQQYRKSLIHECVTGKRRIAEDDLQVIHQYWC